MFGGVKTVRSEGSRHILRAFVALVFAVAFVLAFGVVAGSGDAVACGQMSLQNSAFAEITSSPVVTAHQMDVPNAVSGASTAAEKIAHCCGGAASSCAAASGACSSCCVTAVGHSVHLNAQEAGLLTAAWAGNGLAAPDPAPDYRPPRLIG